jgi:hypothetical protein
MAPAPRSTRRTGLVHLFDMDEDLGAYLRGQQVLGPDVHRHHEQSILNARPIPPSGQQIAARPPIDVAAWIVWERDGLQIIHTAAQAWAGRDVLVAISDIRWPVLGVWLAAQDVRRR